MPWRDATAMDQRTQFIADYLRDALAITELCEHCLRVTRFPRSAAVMRLARSASPNELSAGSVSTGLTTLEPSMCRPPYRCVTFPGIVTLPRQKATVFTWEGHA